MNVGVGYCDHPDSAFAGKQAALEALNKGGRSDPCSFALLFCTARHNQQTLRQEVAGVLGRDRPIYGGGAVGIITNDAFGYAGDQVGVACIWLDDSECTILTEGGLLESEYDTGTRLGQRLRDTGINPGSAVMMFYDAINSTTNPMRLFMATWILDGIKNGLGYLPDLMGAGMQGDHLCTPAHQYLGDRMGYYSVFSLAFSEDIQVDHVIMHGCRPASPYYTVTKAEGPVILEIDGEPAVQFVDKLLGPALKPEDYPFFLLLGLNHGDPDAPYDENNYASRLCLGIDSERGGIVMFEPDMVVGTRFQIMYRAMELDYMQPKIDELFERIGDRNPCFALYIDCAGRCAGYGGMEMEDAYVIQNAVGDSIPLLGLYTGVEIASIGGQPRGLDWTGVLCIFSKSNNAANTRSIAPSPAEKPPRWQSSTETLGSADLPSPPSSDADTARRMTALCEQNLAKVLSLDAQTIAIRHELEQKRRGFSLLAELSVSLRQVSNDETILGTVAKRINSALNMQKTAVLFTDPHGQFYPSVLQGFTLEEKTALMGQRFTLDPRMLDMENSVLITAADEEHNISDLRSALGLPYFISTPIIVENKVVAVLITGRIVEAPPFLSRLGRNDMETVQAIAALLATVLVYQRLGSATRQAQTDPLTGLYNRAALEHRATDLLRQDLPHGKIAAFILIDVDYFKQINDSYGHIIGDKALKVVAQTLRSSFRATDVIGRVGGDEFAIFCPLTGEIDNITHRVERLVKEWSATPITTQSGISFYSTLSIGIALAPKDGTTYNELLHKADIALYRSKQLGRNRFSVYNADTMTDFLMG